MQRTARSPMAWVLTPIPSRSASIAKARWASTGMSGTPISPEPSLYGASIIAVFDSTTPSMNILIPAIRHQEPVVSRCRAANSASRSIGVSSRTRM